MMTYKLKVKAFLHDPIHKQYVIWCLKKDHQEAAKECLEQILYGESVDDPMIKNADHIASAISRIVVAPKDENIKKTIDEIVTECDEIGFIDIFALKKQAAGKPNNEIEVKEFFKRLGNLNFKNQEERAKLFFLFLWRFLPEIFPWINTHPADSRAPNHSIYDHLVQTSAIVSCLPKPAFLLFTIGPVQEFISKARKTSDLWAGSYLLSYLTFKAIEAIIEELGPDNVIYPNLLRQPLVDRWLFEKFKNSPIQDCFQGEKWYKEFINNCFLYEKLTIANFPNRFLAIIPYDTSYDTSLANNVEEKVKQELIELSNNVESVLKNLIQAQSVKDKIKEHLLSHFQIYWVVLPWTNNKPNSPDEALEDYGKIVSKDSELYKTVKTIVEHSYYKPANVGSTYSLLLELTEKLLGARKSLRNYIENNYYEGDGEKCHLCGEFEILILDVKDNKKVWNSLPKDIVKEDERLCGVCLTKRLLPRIIKNSLQLQNEVRFPSTSEMASLGEKIRLNDQVKKDFHNIFINKNWELPSTISVPKLKNNPLYEIDGQWLMEESYRVEYLKNEYGLNVSQSDFNDILDFIQKNKISPSKYYSIIMMDGDNMGKWLKGEFNPKIKEVIDERISNFLSALNDKDLNFILCSKHPNSPSIHQSFSRRLSEFALEEVRKIVEEDHYGKLIYAGGDDVLAFLPLENVLECSYEIQKRFKEILSQKASMSAGIVIVYHKYPLYLALEEVRKAEKTAKDKFGKDAFCIKLIRHSGEVRETGGKWNLIEFIKDLICRFKNQEIPSRFPYELLEEIEKIKDDKILKTELKRIYLRKEKVNTKYLNEILKQFEDYRYDKIDFANMFLISKFMASERRL